MLDICRKVYSCSTELPKKFLSVSVLNNDFRVWLTGVVTGEPHPTGCQRPGVVKLVAADGASSVG